LTPFLAQIAELTEAASWSTKVLYWTVDLGILVVTISMVLCIGRLVRGPHLADRALAADTLAIELIGFVILFMIRLQNGAFIDSVLLLSLLSFAGTVAMAQYIGRHHFDRVGKNQHGKPHKDALIDSDTEAQA